MKKNLLWALLIMAFCVLTFIFTKGHVNLALSRLVVRDVPVSLALMIYTGLGISIGVLLK
jgi:hypothetical protein